MEMCTCHSDENENANLLGARTARSCLLWCHPGACPWGPNSQLARVVAVSLCSPSTRIRDKVTFGPMDRGNEPRDDNFRSRARRRTAPPSQPEVVVVLDTLIGRRHTRRLPCTQVREKKVISPVPAHAHTALIPVTKESLSRRSEKRPGCRPGRVPQPLAPSFRKVGGSAHTPSHRA